MRTLVFCFALLPAALLAQRRMAPGPAAPRTPVPITNYQPAVPRQPGVLPHQPGIAPSAGALGGRYLSSAWSRPLGGIVQPQQVPIIRPYGNRPYRYIGPVYYVPNAFDTYAGVEAAPVRSVGPAPPVVVNQYFGSDREDYARTEFRADARPAQPAELPGDPLTPQQNYYLIAYKDRSIYSALAYWVEGDTLHYVTTQNTHNQASLNLIDLEQTKKLNADQAVPFSIGADATAAPASPAAKP